MKVERKYAAKWSSSCTHGDEFLTRRKTKSKSGYTVMCAECHRVKARAFAKANPGKVLAWTREWKREWRRRILATIGSRCVCCASTENITLDHIAAVGDGRVRSTGGESILREASQHPERFQILCKPCNRWKDVGPFCPCPMWRQSGWRPASEVPKACSWR